MAVTVTLHMRDGVVGDAREYRSRDVYIVTTNAPGNGDDSNPTGTAARAAGLPSLLTAGVRPDAPGLLADSYGGCRALDGQIGTKWEVEVLYSSTGRFRYEPTQDRTNTGFNTIQDGSSRQILEVPYFSVCEATAASTVGGQPAPRWKFIKGVTRTDLALLNPQIRVNVNRFTHDDRSRIAKELNKIHSLDPSDRSGDFPKEPSKFVAYTAEQHADGLWTIVYSWIQDLGTAALDRGTVYIDPATHRTVMQIDYANGKDFNQANPLGIETLICGVPRAPFHSYVVIPSGSGKKPNIKAIAQYAQSDVTGYAGAASLPGRPV